MAPSRTFGKLLRSLGGDAPIGDQGTVWILGDGKFGIDVVGESNYQEALEEAVGGRKPKGVHETATVELLLEDDNPYDDQAVAVLLDGAKVGYLSRDNARLFRAELGGDLASARKILCKGRVRGGWSRGPRDRGHFGVTLDIASRDG